MSCDLMVYEIISAIFHIYQRNSIYISDFPNISTATRNISAILKYIDLPTKRDNLRKKRLLVTAASLILEE